MTLWQFVDIRCLRPIVHHSFTSSTQQDSENVVINIKILSSYGQLFTWLALSSKSLPCSHVEMTCEMFVSHVVWRSCTIWHNMSAMPAQVMLQTVKHAPTSNLTVSTWAICTKYNYFQSQINSVTLVSPLLALKSPSHHRRTEHTQHI